jgi:exopolysaccharide production protein ExoF
MFAAQRDAVTSEVNALNQLKSLLNGEVSSLQDKMKNIDQELTLMKTELSNTTNLVQQGLAIAPREYQLRETELETEGRRMDLDTAALRAKEDIGKADQSLIELRNKTRDQNQAELSDTEQKLSETAARIATGTTIVGQERGMAQAGNTAAETEDPPATCIIVRTKDGKPTQIDGDETTKVEPGDTIKITPAGLGKSALDLDGEAIADPPAASTATTHSASTVTTHREDNLARGGGSYMK